MSGLSSRLGGQVQCNIVVGAKYFCVFRSGMDFVGVYEVAAIYSDAWG